MPYNILSDTAAAALLRMLEAGEGAPARPTKEDFARIIKDGTLPVDGHVATRFGLQNLLETAYTHKSEQLALAVLDDPVFLKKFDKHITLLGSVWSLPVLERTLEIKGTIQKALATEKRLNNWLIDDADEPVLTWFIKQGMSLESAVDGKHPFIPVHRFAGRLNAFRFDLMLRLGADPYISDDAGRSFLHIAIDGNSKTAHKLGDTPRRVEELKNFLVVCNNHFLDLDRPDNNGMTALHLAAKFGYAKVAAELIQAGADPHAKDHDNKTPLDLAKAGKRHEAAAALAALRAHETILDTVRRAAAPGKTA